MEEHELEKLIQEVETNDMHPAPFYLKENIMRKLPSQETIKKDGRNQRELLIFSLKIISAAAAAIILLFHIPVFPSITPAREPVLEHPAAKLEDSYYYKLNEKTMELYEKMDFMMSPFGENLKEVLK